MGCTPFLTLAVQKIHCFFGPQKWTRKKSARINAPKKLPTAIFACPSFANKIISTALKLSAKWSSPVARTSVRFVREPRRQKTLSRQSLLTHDRKEGSAYNEGEQYKSVVFNRAFPSLYKKLVEQES